MTASEKQARPFHVMAKPTGSACNLACEYCFFLEKERLYPGVRTRMDDDVLREYITQCIESQPVDDVTITWQGGEPTMMGLDFFRRSVEIADSCTGGKRVSYTMQTNGTLLDERWCEFLRENRVLVGLSLDGPAEMHDTYRLDRQGRPTQARVMEATRLMHQHGVDFNVLCTVHAANAPHPLDVYRFFRDEVQTEWIQFIPIVERVNDDGTTLLQQGDAVTDRSVSPGEWGSFLLGVFSEWVRKDVGRVHANFFEAAFASWVGAPPLMCIFDETCGNALALEYNGDLYSCDHFVEPGYLLGNIMREPMGRLVASEQQSLFGEAKRDTLPACCRDCDVLFACRGECPKNRFRASGDGEPGLNYLCEGYKTFFLGIEEPMRLMARLYQAGDSPAQIMDIIEESEKERERTYARVGRNDPCPCGSGKKFKACHGS